jgi:RNA-directed DNA polymerase
VLFAAVHEAVYGTNAKCRFPGIDGVTWQTHGENLEEKLEDLHDKVHRAVTERVRPDLHSEGRWLETTAEHSVPGGQIVQQAVATVLEGEA